MEKLQPVGISSPTLYVENPGAATKSQVEISFSIANNPQLPVDSVFYLDFVDRRDIVSWK